MYKICAKRKVRRMQTAAGNAAFQSRTYQRKYKNLAGNDKKTSMETKRILEIILQRRKEIL